MHVASDTFAMQAWM